jgi:hypothetical protein
MFLLVTSCTAGVSMHPSRGNVKPLPTQTSSVRTILSRRPKDPVRNFIKLLLQVDQIWPGRTKQDLWSEDSASDLRREGVAVPIFLLEYSWLTSPPNIYINTYAPNNRYDVDFEVTNMYSNRYSRPRTLEKRATVAGWSHAIIQLNQNPP